MSDHPEVPRVEFFGDGHSMNIRQAVSRFHALLQVRAGEMADAGSSHLEWSFKIVLRPCDCDSDIRGRDDYCPLHGDKA